ARPGERRFDHLDGRVLVLEIGEQRPGEIVTHVEVFRIEQQRAVDKFASAVELPQYRKGERSEGERRAVVGIACERVLDLSRELLRTALKAGIVALRKIARGKHAPAVEVTFHQLGTE